MTPMDKKIEEMRWNNAVTAVVSLYMKDNRIEKSNKNWNY